MNTSRVPGGLPKRLAVSCQRAVGSTPIIRSRANSPRRPASARQRIMTTWPAGIDRLCVNTIRTLAIDAIQKANFGHPGPPMGMAPTVYTLWQRILRFDPQDPIWPNRDRFVLSAGHGSMLLQRAALDANAGACRARVHYGNLH